MAREAKFPAQISALVQPRVRAYIDEIAERYNLAAGEVIRLALDEGLPSAEARIQRERAIEADRKSALVDVVPERWGTGA